MNVEGLNLDWGDEEQLKGNPLTIEQIKKDAVEIEDKVDDLYGKYERFLNKFPNEKKSEGISIALDKFKEAYKSYEKILDSQNEEILKDAYTQLEYSKGFLEGAIKYQNIKAIQKTKCYLSINSFIDLENKKIKSAELKKHIKV